MPASNNTAAKKDRKRIEAEQRKQLQPLRKEIIRLETQLDSLHTRQKQLEALLADAEIYAVHNKHKLQKHLLEKADIDQQSDTCEEAWLLASEALEVAQRDLEKT